MLTKRFRAYFLGCVLSFSTLACADDFITDAYRSVVTFFQGEPEGVLVRGQRFLKKNKYEVLSAGLFVGCIYLLYKHMKTKKGFCRVVLEVPEEMGKKIKDLSIIYDLNERELVLRAIREFFEKQFQ